MKDARGPEAKGLGDIQGPADNGGETPDSDQGDSSANGNGSAGNDEGGAASQGGVSGAVSDGFGSVLTGRLPDTGGGWTVLALLAGVVLIVGGLLVRRFAR